MPREGKGEARLPLSLQAATARAQLALEASAPALLCLLRAALPRERTSPAARAVAALHGAAVNFLHCFATTPILYWGGRRCAHCPLSPQAAPQALRDSDSGVRGSGGAARDSGAEAAELLGKALGCVAVACCQVEQCRQVEQAAALAPEPALGLATLGPVDALVLAVLPTEGARVGSFQAPLFNVLLSSYPRPQHLVLRRQASSALDTHRWRALDAVVRLSGYALGAEAHARAFAAAYSALSTANQEAMVPLLACLRLLLAHAVRSSCLPSTLLALGKSPREGAPRGEMLAALAGMLGRACWAALMDCRGGTAAAALTAAFLDTALAPELFDCALRLRRDLHARFPSGAPGALAFEVAWLLSRRIHVLQLSRRCSSKCCHTMPVPSWPVWRRGPVHMPSMRLSCASAPGARCTARAARCTGQSSSCGAWRSARPRPPR